MKRAKVKSPKMIARRRADRLNPKKVSPGCGRRMDGRTASIQDPEAIARVDGPPVLSRPAYPVMIERKMSRILVDLVDQWKAAAREVLLPYLPGLDADRRAEIGRVDAEDWQSTARDLGNKLVAKIDEVNAGGSPLFDGVAFEVDQWNVRQSEKWEKKIGRAVPGMATFNPANIRAEVKAFSGSVANLITAVGDDTRAEVSRIVFEGLQRGERSESIAKKIFATGKVAGLPNPPFEKAKKRAQLIARDQVGKLNGSITRNRLSSLGIDSYIWRNVADERVRGNPTGKYPKARPSHWTREGLVFRWDKPPEGGNPGEAILCRCWAEPFIEGVTANIGVGKRGTVFPTAEESARGTAASILTAAGVKIARKVIPAAVAPTPAPAPAPTPAPAKYWDSNTESGQWHDAADMANAKPEILEITKAAGEITVNEDNSTGGAHFSTFGRYISMRNSNNKKNISHQSTWRHEFGHAIDSSIGGFDGISVRQQFRAAIAIDDKELRALAGRGTSKVAKAATAARESELSSLAIQKDETVEQLRKRLSDLESEMTKKAAKSIGVSEKELSDWIGQFKLSNKSNFFNADYEAIPNSSYAKNWGGLHTKTAFGGDAESFFIATRIRILQTMERKSGTDFIVTTRSAFRMIERKYRSDDYPDFDNMSDAIGSITNNNVAGYNLAGCGHTDGYYKDRGGANGFGQPKETFANCFSILYKKNEGISAKIFRHFMPETSNAFDDIIKTAAKNISNVAPLMKGATP